MTANQDLKWARRGTILSMVAYAMIATAKITAGHWLHSSALAADGLNNFSDTISAVLMFIGIHLAHRPADFNHQYGHRKMESITTLIISFIILFIGGQVTLQAVIQFFTTTSTQPSPISALIGLISGIIMLGVYAFNLRIAHHIHSTGLKATAKDNLADALTSFVTAIAIITSQFNLFWIDGVMALIVGIIIIKTGIDVFREAAFELSDGFSPAEIERYKHTIYQVPDVRKVQAIRGRTYGPHVYLDITIAVDPMMTVKEGHDITVAVEKVLYMTYFIEAIDVHVEPDN